VEPETDQYCHKVFISCIKTLENRCRHRHVYTCVHSFLLSWVDYRNFDSKRFNGNVFFTYCANLIKIGPVTPQITRAKTTPLWTIGQKLAFHTKYLSIYGIDRDHNFSFCKRQNWPSSLFALAFRNKMQYRFVNARISYTNVSASCEILVTIGAVTSEFKRAKCENLPRLGWNLTIIAHLACWRSETDWNIKILITVG